MKLIDLLVQELPKRGGWPEAAKDRISMHDDGSIYFDGEYVPEDFNLPQCDDGWHIESGLKYTNAVTRDQYESALAASQQPAWNGEGLPPVGTECEMETLIGWAKIRINAYADVCAFITWLSGPYSGGDLVRGGFEMRNIRPLRTEAERRREVACKTMTDRIDMSNELAELIYEDIAAGKIPGVKLED